MVRNGPNLEGGPLGEEHAYFDAARDALILNGRARGRSRNDQIVLHPSDVVGLTASQLAGVLRDADEHWGEYESVSFADTNEIAFNEDYAPQKPYELYLPGGRDAELMLTHPSDNESFWDLTTSDVAATLAPLTRRHKLTLREITPSYYRAPGIFDLVFDFDPSRRSLTSLLLAAEELGALLVAFDTGQLSRESARDLVMAGHAAALVGQRESSWLEAKTTHYDFAKLEGKVDVASAVARFANSLHGGLVVVGMRTKGDQQGELISRITPVPSDPKVARRYRHIVEEHLYPPPDEFRVHVVDYAEGQLVLLDVPPQPEELKPFLVHGAIVGTRGEGRFISIVRRSEDDSIATTAAMIHSTIVAGRAFLRGERLAAANPEPPSRSQSSGG